MYGNMKATHCKRLVLLHMQSQHLEGVREKFVCQRLCESSKLMYFFSLWISIASSSPSHPYPLIFSICPRTRQIQPSDYSLWNKLGATLANSSRSGEAISAYRRALDLKPNYLRAWVNMGISYANLANYAESAKYYIQVPPQISPARPFIYLHASVRSSAEPSLRLFFRRLFFAWIGETFIHSLARPYLRARVHRYVCFVSNCTH
jgi:tetratricopeptide (TPR) repeat protein